MIAMNDAGTSRPTQTAVPAMGVLLVDDHTDSLRMLRLLLRAAGYRVAAAADLASARAIARDGGEGDGGGGFDLLVTDIKLPDGDGRALLADLRAANPAARGAVLTGWATADEQAPSAAAGFEWVLAKPIQVEQLMAVAAAVDQERL